MSNKDMPNHTCGDSKQRRVVDVECSIHSCSGVLSVITREGGVCDQIAYQQLDDRDCFFYAVIFKDPLQ